MSKAEKVSRIKDILLKHNGEQVGGKDSNRIEIDLSMLLEFMSLEDRIQELESQLISIKDLIDEVI